LQGRGGEQSDGKAVRKGLIENNSNDTVSSSPINGAELHDIDFCHGISE